MVMDVVSAVDFLYCRSLEGRADPKCGNGEVPTPSYPDVLTFVPLPDMKRVYAAGYSIGGAVALHAAFFDSRISGVASFSGFTPMRTDDDSRPTGGAARWYSWHSTLPRLGWLRDPSLLQHVPYDYDELISALAPRQALFYTPLQDRDSTLEDVNSCLTTASEAWAKLGASSNFTRQSPDRPTIFSNIEIHALTAWLQSLEGKR
jgi:hypothetical protein